MTSIRFRTSSLWAAALVLALAAGGCARTSAVGVRVVRVEVEPADAALPAGFSTRFNAHLLRNDGAQGKDAVAWTSSDPEVASVDAAGIATAHRPGAAVITATAGKVSGEATLEVRAAELLALAVEPAQPQIPLGASLRLSARGTLTDGSTADMTALASWSSDAPEVAEVSAGALVTGLREGQALLTVSAPAAPPGTTPAPGTASVLAFVHVTVGPPVPREVQVTPPAARLPVGAALHLAATAVLTDGTVQDVTALASWSADLPERAEVSDAPPTKGLVTGVAAGEATLTAAVGEVKGTAKILVTDAVLVAVSVTPAAPALGIGTVLQLSAAGLYDDGTSLDVTAQAAWSSSAPEVAGVSDAAETKGLVTGVAAGTATVVALVDGVAGSAEVRVTAAPLQSVTVSPAGPILAPGVRVQLFASGVYGDGTVQDLTAQAAWTSSDPQVATVSDDPATRGLVTALAPGAATVQAAFGGVAGDTPVTVTSAALTAIEVSPASLTLARGAEAALAATGIFDDGTRTDLTAQAVWTSSDAAVAPVSNAAGSQGRVTALAPGSAVVTATLGEGGGVAGEAQVTVTAAALESISVTPADPAVASGTRVQLHAAGLYDDGSNLDLTSLCAWTSADPSVAAVSSGGGSPGLVSALAAGEAVVGAAFQGVQGSTRVTVTAAVLVELQVAPPAPTLAAGTALRLGALGLFSDGSSQDLTEQVAWTSSDAQVAAVSNSAGSRGLCTALAVGTATVTAVSGAVSATAAVTVTAATLQSIAVTPAATTVARGTVVPFKATGSYGDGSTQDLTALATWASSEPSVAAVSNAPGSEGVATAVGAGTAAISALFAGVTGQTTLAVSAAMLTSIAVAPTNPAIAKGTAIQLAATGAYDDGTVQDLTTQVTWSTSNAAVATVSNAAGSRGLAAGTGAGTATLAASLGGVSGATQLTVTAATLGQIAVTPVNPLIAKGTTLQLAATGTFSDGSTQDLTAQATWTSSNLAVATVSNAAGSAGLAAGVDAGTAAISATLAGVMGASTLTVTAATLQSITVTPAGPSIARGTTIQLTATGAYSDGTTQDLTGQAAWSSSDDAVAAVSNDAASKGLAAGLAPGTATITAALAGLTGATVLTVTAATLQSIAVTPVNPSLARGTTVQLAATGSYSDGSTQDLTAQVGWASSDVSVATISNAPPTRGLATAIAAGTTTLSATLGLVVGTTTLTVTAATLDAITVTPVGASIAAGTTLQLAATGTYSDGTTQDLTFQVTWTSSDAAIATVSNAPSTKGLATGVGAGTATLTAAFQGVSGTTTLGVTAATLQALVITPADPTIAAGTTVQFSASGSYSDGSVQDLTTQVSWISSNTTFATVSNAPGSEGLAAARSAGTTTISATFSGVTGTTTLTVSGVSLQSIIVSPADATIARGTTLQYTAFGVYSDGSTQDITTLVTWASSDTAIAVVSNSPGTQGLVTALAAGVTTVSAALSGIGGSTGLTVTQATLVSIAVTPPQKPLKVGRTQQYTATGTYSDGSRQVITTQVTWSSSNTAAAVISNAPGSQGVATAVAVGSTEIGAQSGNVSGAARLNVTP